MEEEKTQPGQTSADEGDVDEMFVSGMTGRRRYSPQTAHGANVSTAGPAC